MADSRSLVLVLTPGLLSQFCSPSALLLLLLPPLSGRSESVERSFRPLAVSLLLERRRAARGAVAWSCLLVAFYGFVSSVESMQ